MRSCHVFLLLLLCTAILTAGCQKQVAKTDDDEITGFYETTKEFKDALTKCKLERDAIAQSLQHLETRKRETVQELKDLGVSSAADAFNDDKTQLLVNSLETLVKKTKRLESDIERYDQAIIRIEAKLKELEIIELSNDVGLSDEQSMELSRTIIDLNEQMGIKESPTLLDELELERLLEEEFDTDPKEPETTNQESEDKPASDQK